MAIALHDFETTLGTHNRGNVQLGDGPDATLQVVNNHRLWTVLNDVRSDPEANRRVRTALLVALTGDGRLTPEYVRNVRIALLGDVRDTADLTRLELKALIDEHKTARAVGERMKAVFEESTEDFHPAAESDVFDNMTTRAARQATEIFSSRAFIRLLPANLTSEFRQQLEEDAMLAEAGLHEIYGLTGADLVAGNVAIGNGIATTVDRFVTEEKSFGKGYPDTMQVARINAANRRAAELLGIPEVAVRVTVGMHNGVFGFFMDEAPGATGYEASNAKGEGSAKGRLAGLVSYDTFPTLSRADQLKVLSPVLKGFADLEWLDWLTGQMDRHGDNYKLVVRPDFTGSVQGIDNDGAFPTYRTGLYTYRFNVAGAERKLLDVLHLSRREDLLAKYPNKVRVENGILVVNCEDDKMLTYGIWQTFGLNSSNKPLAVSREFHAKLLAIKDPVAWVEDLLGAHFTAEQKQATVARLREMIDYAKTLDPATQVLSQDDWKDPTKVVGVFRRIVRRGNVLHRNARTDSLQRNMYELESDYWMRDFIRNASYTLKSA